MKKIFIIFIVFLLLCPYISVYASIADREYFIVTAYYSPLPNQDYYVTGDFESEKILQGRGTHGASGKGVFSGMLAAPSKYDFGTKIYLQGLGIGVVEDRGGAIVKAGERGYEYDRIDVWMGYGDEGLRRALWWGKRKVAGYISSYGSSVTMDYKKYPAPKKAVSGMKKVQKKPEIFYKSIGKGSEASLVKNLQRYLQGLSLYTGEINGEYNQEIIDIVYDFQVKNKIITAPTDIGAAYWGQKTRTAFYNIYGNGEGKINKKAGGSENTVHNNTKKEKQGDSFENEYILELVIKKEREVFRKYEGTQEEREQLAQVFSELKLRTSSEIFTKQEMIQAVYDFQIQQKIVRSESDYGAGYYGPKTRKKLKELYVDHVDSLISLEKEKLAIQKKEKEQREKIELLVKEKTKNLRGAKIGDTGNHVRELQKLLAELGYFDHKDTAYFGDVTREAVAEFQIENNLITGKESQYAGILGEKTINVLEEKIYEKQYRDIEKEKKEEKMLAST